MKKLNLSIFWIIVTSIFVSHISAVNVTFQVDMSQQTVSSQGVHVAGSFQNWDPAATQLSSLGNDIYSVTISIVAGEYIEFKYVNGNAWGSDESVPSACGVNNGQGGYNRFFTVPNSDVTLDLVCFANCGPCSGALVNVTFNVDLSQQTIASQGIHIAGNFQNWNPGGTQLTAQGNNIFTYTTTFPEGFYVEYKYINGDNWGMDESVPASCSSNNNRFLLVPSNDTILPAVCFGSCYPCQTVFDTVDVTFLIDMSNQIVDPQGVHIAGSFQNWDPATNQMTHIGNNVYQSIFPLLGGEYYEYKFVNGNAWGSDEVLTGSCSANGNRYLQVPLNDTILPLICYESCDPCPPPQMSYVTFRVDMSDVSVISDSIHIAGNFQSWDPGSTLMFNSSGNIYEYSEELVVGSIIEYKFINGNTWNQVEIVPVNCSQNGNRYFEVTENDTILPLVCFESCVACNTPTIEVTFQLMFCNTIVSDSGVHIAGTFQNWNPGATQMTALGSDYYTYTIQLPEGEYHEYKFINGNDWLDAENVPGACSQNYNRYLTVPVNDTILPVVCFGECSSPDPGWFFSNTGIEHSINISALTNISIGQNQLDAGDYIGVFYDSLGIPACGGYLNYLGDAGTVIANGDYSGINGFLINESFLWKIWDASEDTVYSAIATYNLIDFPDEAYFVENGSSGLVSLIAETMQTQTILLSNGWSIISSYINPDLPSLSDIFLNIQSLNLCKSGNGSVFWPAFGINNIGNWSVTEGYQINISQNDTLEITGNKIIPENTVLNLSSGWSIIAYLRDSEADISTLMSTVSSYIVIVKNDQGSVYWPTFGINNIGNMIPGEGYQIKMNSTTNYTYPAN